MITLKWHGDLPDCDLTQLEYTVLTDIKRNLSSLEKPSNLCYHVVFLGADYDGPSVTVWGESGDDSHFHCEYSEATEWVSGIDAEDV